MPQLTSSVSCNTAWNAVASPNVGGGRNVLTGMAAIAPNDVWAVGFYAVVGSNLYQTLAEHWDGNTWTVVPTPNVGPGNNLLIAVTAIGPRDVWAVGFVRSGNSSTAAQMLTEHWNGNGWSVVPTPQAPATSSTQLISVGSDPLGDVWAVGISINFPINTTTGPRGHAVALRWMGTAWSSLPTAPLTAPVPGRRIDAMSLNGVKVLGPNDAWAVGDGREYSGPASSPDMAFIEHWNGSSWSQVAAPFHPNGDFLSEVQGTASDLWAVGGQAASTTTDTVVVERWNGTSWSDVGSSIPPAPPDQSADLFALAYISPTNVWAVGARSYQSPGTTAQLDDTLVEHWDGSSWYPVISDNPASNQDLFTVAAISANDVWAGGAMGAIGYEQTLTENFCMAPTITSVAPSSGNAGDSVVINGSGFIGAVDVEFGTAPASFHVDSDTKITATSPGHKAGMVDIRVTVQGTSATSSADQFTYLSSRSGGAAEPGTHLHGGTLPPPPPIRVMTVRFGATPRAAPIPI
jgi:hypothetical protein